MTQFASLLAWDSTTVCTTLQQTYTHKTWGGVGYSLALLDRANYVPEVRKSMTSDFSKLIVTSLNIKEKISHRPVIATIVYTRLL